MKNFKRTSLLLVAILSCFLVSGCDNYGLSFDGDVPSGLNGAKRPLILVATGEQGIVIKDAVGNLYSYNEIYSFAQAIMASDLKPGDVIVDN